jgi:peptidyl-prolyl cis-trans isomerase SurA
MRNVTRLACAACLLAAAPAVAQTPDTPPQTPGEPELIGYIVAVVGDSIITNFDMQEALLAWQSESGQPPPSDPTQRTALARQLLDSRIDQLLLLQAAVRDTTVRVAEEQVLAQVEQRIEGLRQQLGGQAQFESALAQSRLTEASYREMLIGQYRRETLINTFMQRQLGTRKPPAVAEEEIRTFFDENRAQIGELPASITLQQVVIPVAPSDSVLQRTRALADSLLLRARDGEDFAALARQYSADEGSAELGGDVGWFRPGTMVPAFEQAAYSLMRPGDISPPVRSQYGWHVIKLERVRGPERQARHILIKPEITEADIARTRALADSIAGLIREGADIESLAQQFGDENAPVRYGPVPRDSLQGAYAENLRDVQEDQVVGPFLLEDAGGPVPNWVVGKVEDLAEARPATVDDYRLVIQQRIARQKLIEEILQELRRRTHIEIRQTELAGGD